MAPSQVQIATGALQRLIKEEASYYKELDQQQARIAKLERGEGDDPENQEYLLKQEKKGLEETKAVIPGMREKVTSAREKLESVLDQAANEEERNKAFEVLKKAKEAQKDDPVS